MNKVLDFWKVNCKVNTVFRVLKTKAHGDWLNGTTCCGGSLVYHAYMYSTGHKDLWYSILNSKCLVKYFSARFGQGLNHFRTDCSTWPEHKTVLFNLVLFLFLFQCSEVCQYIYKYQSLVYTLTIQTTAVESFDW